MDEAWLRQSIIDAALSMQQSGLSPQRSGNVSARSENGMLITPTGMRYEDLLPDDIVFVGGDGAVASGQRRPSSEWHFHQAIYQARDDAGAVVHCHSQSATVLACARRAIPAFHYMVAVAGGSDIRCAPYATFGTPELAESAVAALTGRRACLLANHGQITLGPDIDAALELAHEVETLAGQYVEVLKLGEVNLLDEAEMIRVLEKFAGYGQRAGNDVLSE